MKKGKRLLAILLSAAMMLSAVPAAAAMEVFQPVQAYTAGQFYDVESSQWYEQSVQKAYELGLMSGDPSGTFRPTGQVTLAETVTVAARIHSLATTGAENFVQGSPWYQVYVDYAQQNGMLTVEPADYSKAATRLEFAQILAKALPAEDLTAINQVADGAIPDVADDQSVYSLYRAGVLTGSDKQGTFLPDSTIQRCEVAAIVTRMALPELRQLVSLGGESGLLQNDNEKPASDDNRVVIRDDAEGEDDEEVVDKEQGDVSSEPSYVDENNALTKPFDEVYPDLFASGAFAYSGDRILIKLEDEPSGKLSAELFDAGVTHLEEMYALPDAVWYKADVTGEVEKVMTAVRAIDDVLVAEYDFAYAVESVADCETVAEAVSGNKHAHKQWHLRHHGIHKIWEGDETFSANHGEGIIVAVIDTGVDYNHEDLKDNIWVNKKEIPNNGIDDDGNDYVDDYYGFNAVANNGNQYAFIGDPMDDHGHGTHVAGVIAGVNNNIGVVGVAYGAKIMAIKAGQSSGYFHQSDIAEAIIYAYENGADVINMSFGGSASTIAVTDALEKAYTDCVLVASAGNDGMPNENRPITLPNYPAALKYVLGVMSVDENGVESAFTNYDVSLYSTKEYEVYAPGEDIMSTIPGNKYASWDGTSMATPIVSAMAAMLRNAYPERGTYPTKFIYGQIVNSGEETATCFDPDTHGEHNLPPIANVYNAVTAIPVPDVGITDYRIFDNVELDPDNNGDGVIDAGETVALGFTVRNRWGMAENTLVTVDALSGHGGACKYVTITDYEGEQNEDKVSATVNYGSVGTYSDGDCGKILDDDDVFIGWEKPFLLEIDEDCPNDYIIKLNVRVQAENGLDDRDETRYTSFATLEVEVRRGVILTKSISKDMTLEADNYYIIPNFLQIEKGVTVRVEPGTQIQFWTDDPHDSYADRGVVYLDVRGTLLLEGTEEEPIEIFPSELMSNYAVTIYESGDGVVKMWHTNIVNFDTVNFSSGGGYSYRSITYAENCEFTQNYRNSTFYHRYLSSSGTVSESRSGQGIEIDLAKDCAFYRYGSSSAELYGHYEGCIFVDCALEFNDRNLTSYDSCVFYGNNNYLGESSGSTSSLTMPSLPSVTFEGAVTDPATGKIYLRVRHSDAYWDGIMERFAEYLGGTLACINSKAEREFLERQDFLKGAIGLKRNPVTDQLIWVDGTEVEEELIEGFRKPSVSGFGYYSNSYDYAIIELPAEYVTSIELDRYAVTIDSETNWQINAQVGPTDMAEALLVYESDDPAIADVDEDGLVTGYAKGDTVIRVYSPDRKIWRELTVHVVDRAPLEAIDLGEDFRMNVEDVRQLIPVLKPANTSQQLLYYESSDEDVLEVTATGKVTALAEGTATITAYSAYSTVYDTVTVEVVIPAEGVEAEESLLLFSQEDETTVADLGIVVYPEDTTDQSLIWESSNPEVAYVDENGILVKGEQGYTTLRATVNGTELYTDILVCISDMEPEVEVVQMEGYSDCYMALLSDGTLWWWGGDTTVPTRMEGFEEVKQFAYAQNNYYSYLLVLTEDGVVNWYEYYRGYNSDVMPKFDVESPSNGIFPNGEPLSGVKAVACSTRNGGSCYVLKEDGSVWVWGENDNGQLGTGDTIDVSGAMVQMDLQGKQAEAVVAIYRRCYVLDGEGTVWSYGGSSDTGTELTEYAAGVLSISADVGKDYVIIEKEDTIRSGGNTYTKQGEWNTARDYTHAWIDEDGTVYIYLDHTGYPHDNIYGALGVGHNGHVLNYEPVLKVENASRVFLAENNSFFQTADGKFYSVGLNNNNQMGNLAVGNSSVPRRMYFGMNAESTEPVLYQSAFADGRFTVELDQSVLAGSYYARITLTDAEGTNLSMKKELYLDKISVEPYGGWIEGAEYTLTIPKNAVKNLFSISNSEEIAVTFTAGEPVVDDGDEEIEELPEILEPATDGGLKTDDSIQRETWDEERLMAQWAPFDEAGYNTTFWNNAILNRMVDDNVSKWLRITAPSASDYVTIGIGGNYWGTTSQRLIDEQILDFDDFQSLADLNEGEILTTAPEKVWPFVVNAGLIDNTGEEVDVIGNETVTFFVAFNRDMDTEMELDVRFGSYYPFADYRVEGDWVDERRWEGTTTLTTIIENGYQYWTIMNGRSAADENGEHLPFYEDWGRFSFEIDTTEAQAMILQGDATETGISLTWSQDDFDTLMGYNVYRADKDEDSYYQRLNSSIIPVGEEEFFDTTVLPGQIYYYKFTVVKTDMSESAASGKIRIMSMDTMAPGMYHTPVYHAYAGSNLVISAVVTDNLAEHPVVKLHYRTVGEDTWKIAEMTALNDKYSAVIGFNEVTTEGVEYYISAFDGVNTTYSGGAAAPHQITVQEPLDQSSLGDVDDDGYVTLLDALMVLQAKNELIQLTQDAFDRGDLNGDGRLTSAEALKILMYANGQIGSLQS